MRFYHCFLLFALCVSQFLPLAFCFMALPTILLSQGMPLHKVSFLYVFGFVWVFKFLWAPLIDKINFGRWGHYKIWLLLSQSLLVATVVLFSLIGGDENNPDHFYLVFVLGLIISMIASTQDIAADAIACRLIPENRRGLGSAIQLSGGLVATIVGGGVILMTYTYIGWAVSLWIIALLVASVLFLIACFDESEIALSEDAVTSTPNFSRLFLFWRQPGMAIWALILIIAPLSITIAWALSSPILIDLGWSPDKIGILLHIIAPVAGIACSAIIGHLLNKYDKWLVFSFVPVFQFITLLILLMVLGQQLNLSIIIVALLLVYVMDISLYLILNAFKLEYSSDGSEGADFTVQNSLHGFAAFGTAAIAVYFAEMVGFQTLIMASLILTLLSGSFLYLVIRNNYKRQTIG